MSLVLFPSKKRNGSVFLQEVSVQGMNVFRSRCRFERSPDPTNHVSLDVKRSAGALAGQPDFFLVFRKSTHP